MIDAQGSHEAVATQTDIVPEAAGASSPPMPVPVSSLPAALEAALIVAEEPVSSVMLAHVVGVPEPEIVAALQALAAAYVDQHRGFELREVAGGWRFYSNPDYAAVVERFVLDGRQSRLSQAALETLAIVAYQQPVARARIAAVRGVNVDGVVRTLLARGLIVEAGQDGPNGALLYTTTDYFLERLGLRAVTDLPPIAPLLPDISDASAE